MGWNFVSCSCHRAEVKKSKIVPAHFQFSILPQICNLGYEWYFNGNPIPGATADTLELVRAGINPKYSPLPWLLPGYRKLLAENKDGSWCTHSFSPRPATRSFEQEVCLACAHHPGRIV